MAFNLLILTSSIKDKREKDAVRTWPDQLRKRLPDVRVTLCESVEEAHRHIGEVDAAFGDIVPELFSKAKRLRWIHSPRQGQPPEYYHKALVESPVQVTIPRAIFSDHIAHQVLAYVLSFSRGIHHYVKQQALHQYGPNHPVTYLPDCTALIVGMGGIGVETARLCVPFGMRVIGIDARRTDPLLGVAEMHGPSSLHSLLPQADFVILTVPHTPETEKMFTMREFKLMKRSGVFINVGRGATVVLDDLTDALNSGTIGGAALDVYEIEPLPAGHRLWDAPNTILTPHMAGEGAYIDDRRREAFFENCARFIKGEPLKDVVDKRMRF